MEHEPVPPASRPVPAASQKRDRVVGLSVVAGAFLLSLGISLWAKGVSEPETSQAPAPPTTAGIQGWPNKVDPLALLERARSLTPRPLLRGIVAEGVASDGTIDLRSATAYARYSFQSPPGHGPQPPREPGVVPRRANCGRQSVRVGRQGIEAEADQAHVPCPALQREPLPEPRCTFAAIWRHARKLGANPEGRARIEYYRAAAGPAYRFELPGTSIRFSLYGDCERQLTTGEAVGSVP